MSEDEQAGWALDTLVRSQGKPIPLELVELSLKVLMKLVSLIKHKKDRDERETLQNQAIELLMKRVEALEAGKPYL